MNPKIKKVINEIERTKAKIAELQALLPQLERKRIEMENNEMVRLIRSADISPADLPAFLESLKTEQSGASLVARRENADSGSAFSLEQTSAVREDFSEEPLENDEEQLVGSVPANYTK